MSAWHTYNDSPECGHDLNMARWEAEYDSMAQEYEYEDKCHDVGVLPYGAWGRENDADYAYDQPESVAK